MANSAMVDNLERDAETFLYNLQHNATTKEQAYKLFFEWAAIRLSEYEKATHRKRKTNQKVAESYADLLAPLLRCDQNTSIEERQAAFESCYKKFALFGDILAKNYWLYIGGANKIIKQYGRWPLKDPSYMYQLTLQLKTAHNIIIARLLSAKTDRSEEKETKNIRLLSDPMLRMELATSEEYVTALRQERTNLNLRVNEISDERDRLQLTMADTYKQLKTALAGNQALEKQLKGRDKGFKAIDALENENKALNENVDRLKKEQKAQQEAHLVVVNELNAKKAESQAQLEKMKTLESQISEAKKALQEKENAIALLKNQANSFSNVLNQVGKDDKPAQGIIASLTQEVLNLNEQNAKKALEQKKQQQSLNETRDILATKEGELAPLKAHIATQAQQLKENQERVGQLDQELQALQKEHQFQLASIASMTAKLARQKDEIARKDIELLKLPDIEQREKALSEKEKALAAHEAALESKGPDALNIALKREKQINHSLRRDHTKLIAESKKIAVENEQQWNLLKFLWRLLTKILSKKQKAEVDTQVDAEFGNVFKGSENETQDGPFATLHKPTVRETLDAAITDEIKSQSSISANNNATLRNQLFGIFQASKKNEIPSTPRTGKQLIAKSDSANSVTSVSGASMSESLSPTSSDEDSTKNNLPGMTNG